MRIVLDVTATGSNRIEGTASWVNGGEPVPFTGWLALMRLFEDASAGEDEGTVNHHGPDAVNLPADDPPG